MNNHLRNVDKMWVCCVLLFKIIEVALVIGIVSVLIRSLLFLWNAYSYSVKHYFYRLVYM